MTKAYKILCDYLKQVRKYTDFEPEVAIVLGSGLGDFAENIKKECVIDYHDIEGFPVSTNKTHKGRFVFGYVERIPVVIMEGRIHYYEGYTIEQVVTPIRLMKMMGADKLIITNAVGGINPDFTPGDLMLISDHLSFFIPSPLISENIEELGTRFPDMTNVYDREYRAIAMNCAKELSIDLKSGVYVQITGPNYETPAEINAFRLLGADAVGMSTACEAMAATHCGMKVCGISCITNMAAGITGQPLNDDEVIEIASSISDKFSKLLLKLIPQL